MGRQLEVVKPDPRIEVVMDGRIRLAVVSLGFALLATACQRPVSCVATGETTKCYGAKGELVSVNGNPVTEMDGQRVICATYTHEASQRLTERCVTLDGEVVRDAYVDDPSG